MPDAAYAAEGAGQGNPRVNATQRVAKPAAPQAPALAAVPAWDASSPENAAAIAALPPGVVQQFTDGSTSFGSVPGRGGEYTIPGQSAPLVQPAGGGGNLVQVIRGGQSSYTRPDGTGIALYPTMAGPLSELSQPQRARDAAVNYGHELSANAAIEGHRLAAGATLGAATIHETGATDRADTAATDIKKMGTAVYQQTVNPVNPFGPGLQTYIGERRLNADGNVGFYPAATPEKPKPKEGDISTVNGKTAKHVNGVWVPQK